MKESKIEYHLGKIIIKAKKILKDLFICILIYFKNIFSINSLIIKNLFLK